MAGSKYPTFDQTRKGTVPTDHQEDKAEPRNGTGKLYELLLGMEFLTKATDSLALTNDGLSTDEAVGLAHVLSVLSDRMGNEIEDIELWCTRESGHA